MIRFYFLGINLLLFNALTAAIYFEIDTTTPLSCIFSNKHPNRIMVEKQSIENIIHSEPESIQVLIEEKANQAFVMAYEEIEDPITLCVITSNGDVQDLVVTFKEQPSQLVILQEKQQIEQKNSYFTEECQIQDTINSILKGQIPSETCINNFCSDIRYLKNKIQIVEINRFEKEIETIHVFKIINQCKYKQIVHEKELNYENASWVFLEKNTLGAKEAIKAIVSIKKDFSNDTL